MHPRVAVAKLTQEQHFLMNILKDFRPEHGDFAPASGMMTVTQQVRHIAHTVQWFRKGAFGAGFDMDFGQHAEELTKPCTFPQALEELRRTYEEYKTFLASLPEGALDQLMPPNPILGPQPRSTALHAQADHTAHHRGALAVYLRMLGVVPTMVYSEPC